jgi:nitroreductase
MKEYGFYNYFNINTMNESKTIENWIRKRHSTFVNGLSENGKIDDLVIEKVLDNATWAPSHGLVQAWEFIVFTNRGVESFYTLQQSIYKENTAPEKFSQTKYENYLSKVNRVSHIIAVIARRDPKKRYPKQEDIVSVACAVQNMYLSLNAYGIAGYLSTGDICYSQQMRVFLKLGEEDECLGFFTLGVADPDVNRPLRKRIPGAEKTVWIRE